MLRLLVATDFSPRSERAVQRAVLLARARAATLELVHVLDDEQPARLLEAEREAARALLAERVAELERDGIDCRYELALGEAFAGIGARAEAIDADLVLLGPHRRQVLRNVFTGTTAERTIREARKPVLMCNAVPDGPYRHALVATDLAPASGAALALCARLALAPSLAVLHVYDDPGLLIRAAGCDDDVGHDEVRARVADAVAQFLRAHGSTPQEVVLKSGEGDIGLVVLRTARRQRADLVVVGTRARGALAGALLGSVATDVLRDADCDVLAVAQPSSH